MHRQLISGLWRQGDLIALALLGVVIITNSYNDNNASTTPVTRQSGEPHGRVAMLLAESLIHGLIARSVLSTADAIEIVGIAGEVVAETGAENGDTTETLAKSLAILKAISTSLSIDMPPT